VAPDHAGNCAPWCRACTWLVPARWASVIRYAVSTTSFGRTCVWWWSHKLQHSLLVEACQSSLLAHQPTEHYSSRLDVCHGHWTSACQVNAGNAAAAEASRSLKQALTVETCRSRLRWDEIVAPSRRTWLRVDGQPLSHDQDVVLADRSHAGEDCISLWPTEVRFCPRWA